MELLNLPRLRLKELQTVSENSVRICDAIPEVQPAVKKVKEAIADFKASMQKEKVPAATKSELDKKRDKLIYGLVLRIKSDSHYPFTGEKSQAIESLLSITTKYNGINRFRYNEQTAAVDNMIDEMRNVDLQDEDFKDINDWLNLVEQANNDFKAASDSYIESNAQLSDTKSATDMAPLLAESLNGLYSLMFAHARIGTSPAISNALMELEVLLKSLN
ncbi:DUF6261 family protein [Carboxylicivirga sp. M1479]|uniref:DUF6261 family protein n=1 Tax=Carboxylicivirga sp. M1479 TaxID=2594476 RepID=UPI0011776A67|nr:DUF6261 family protein [Carboxylicivirga sp. M1479]TRX64588.1 hypothetical protein FNN09_17600 [Carboxylicivirga sp. M1479]